MRRLPLLVLVVNDAHKMRLGFQGLYGRLSDLKHVLLAEVGAHARRIRLKVVHGYGLLLLFHDRILRSQGDLQRVDIVRLILLNQIRWIEDICVCEAPYRVLGLPHTFQKLADFELPMEPVCAFLKHPS